MIFTEAQTREIKRMIEESKTLEIGRPGDQEEFTNLTQFFKPMDFFRSIRLKQYTPAQITGNQNNYDTGDVPVLRLSSDASRNITGLKNGSDGRYLLVLNIGSNNIVLQDENTSSAAANRIANSSGGDITITPEAGVLLWYDIISLRWRVFSGASGGNYAGVYTPTRSAEANLDSNVTMTEAQWARIGNTIIVSGRFTADPTTTTVATSFEITLPVASNIGAVEDVAGVAFCGSIVSQGAEIIGVVANDTAKIQWKAGDVTSQVWSYILSYQVI